MESRTIKRPVTVQQRAEGEGVLPTIEGYGAVFYVEGDEGTQYRLWDDAYERIMPGAFDSIGDEDVRSFFNHDPNIILGRSKAGTLRLSVDDVGLKYSVDPPDTGSGRSVVESVRRQDVDGSSFIFIPTNVVWRFLELDDQYLEIREIHGVETFEVGPVVFPAYESTTSGVRSLQARAVDDAKKCRSAWAQKHGLPPGAAADLRRKQIDYRARAVAVCSDLDRPA